MQRKVASIVQMIHHQLMGPTTASRLQCHTQSALLSQRTTSACYRFLKAIPVAGDLRSRVTWAAVNKWQYTSVEMIEIKQ